MPSDLKEFKADFSQIDFKIAIVASEFNQHITQAPAQREHRHFNK